MIKRLGILVVAALMIFGVTTLATGPLLGVSVVPTAGTPAILTIGYDFGSVNVEAWKGNMTTPFGLWAVGVLWTPGIGTFGYRAGVELVLNYAWINPTTGQLQYNSLTFIVGVSQTWGPIQIYEELDLTSTAAGFTAMPSIGFNILFGDLIPDGAEL